MSPIAVVGEGAHDIHAGGANVNAYQAIVGEPRQSILIVGGGHRNDIGGGVIGRVEGRGIVVCPVVPRCRHQNHAFLAGVNDSHLSEIARGTAPTTQAHIHNFGAIRDGVIKPRHNVRKRSAAGAQRLNGHDPGFPGNPDHTHIIVANRANGTGYMGSMAIVVHGVPVLIGGVIAIIIVHISVFVIINTVSGHFPRIGPHIGFKVRMVVIHPGVHHGDNRLPCSFAKVPSQLGANVGTGGSPGLPAVVHPPKLRVTGIVGDGLGGNPEILVDALNSWIGEQVVKCCFVIHRGGDDRFEIAGGKVIGPLDIHPGKVGVRLKLYGLGHIKLDHYPGEVHHGRV